MIAVCLVLAACAGTPGKRAVVEPAAATRPVPRPPSASIRPACAECGQVERIESVAAIRATPSGGAVLGGVVGGVLSAPAPVGNAQTPAPGTPRPAQRAWRIHLHMDDGRRVVVHQNLIAGGVVVSARVRLVQGRLVPVH